jgi:hypothetical protein
MDFDDEQLLNISSLFKILNIDEFNYKIAPFNNKLYYIEYAPYDLELEEDCSQGIYCIFKNSPLICPKNHQGLNKIKKGFQLPSLLCKYERPWRLTKDTNQQTRCNNINCWFSHLKGRREHLKNLFLSIKLELNESNSVNITVLGNK